MKKILIFGGTRFFGKRLVEKLINKGYSVTIATRGTTPDDFDDKVKRIILDRSDKNSMSQFSNSYWDIVYDNICYSPDEAKIACDIFENNVGRYIFTSTLSVYDEGEMLYENDFNPYEFKHVLGDKTKFNYKDGKRNAEAYFFQMAKFPVIAVRYPIVLGPDDYTGRLLFHVNSVKNKTPIYSDDYNNGMCFITSSEAADFLYWLMTIDTVGPINACSDGFISLNEILSMIESETGIEPIKESADLKTNVSPFNEIPKYKLSNTKASNLGFKFNNVNIWMKDLIKTLSQ